MVLEKTLENPLDSKEIKPVNPKEKLTLNIYWKDWGWSSNTLAAWCRANFSPSCIPTILFRSGWYIYTEKAMAPHSSTLAWKIPWMEEPGRLQSMGSLRVGHVWATSLSLFTFMHWRRKWQPTPVFLPGESRGRGSLVGCSPWGRTESETTEAT